MLRRIRSYSYLGFSTIYIIFTDDVEFYWSRTRILEKLNSLPPEVLPPGVKPALGPDATALGQVFWYTAEGRDLAGNATGGWDLHELRSIQDWTVRYSLQSAEGVSVVTSIGGFAKEYQVDVNPSHFDAAPPGTSRRDIIFTATSEVGSAVLTTIATTVVSFLPVFTMIAAEGKMFKPLAYTKTFALVASVIVALTIVPALAHLMFSNPGKE